MRENTLYLLLVFQLVIYEYTMLFLNIPLAGVISWLKPIDIILMTTFPVIIVIYLVNMGRYFQKTSFKFIVLLLNTSFFLYIISLFLRLLQIELWHIIYTAFEYTYGALTGTAAYMFLITQFK